MKASKPAQEKAIPKAYTPQEVEKRIYDMWLEQKCFAPQKPRTDKTFSIVMPPPNVTGNLHLGHAMVMSIEDALTRYHRMAGDETVWVPGTDHAGIATQLVVEKHLRQQGKKRQDFSRDGFIIKMWEWVEKYKQNITGQLKSLGASCDWDRERFTFDPEFNTVVNKVFVDLYNKGLIYKDDYIVNWCSETQTVLSDLEVVATEEETKLYHIRYFVKAADKSIVVATTRPETLLGDIAVAVHPNDKRYKEFIDKTLILPIMNREIPVIADERVDPEFGTGAVKITPGHDPLDYEIGRDHNLQVISVIGKDGKMNKNAGKYAGLEVEQARKNIIEYLDNIGNLEEIEETTSSIKRCERTNAMVEPLVSKQWFVKASVLAPLAMKAVEEGKTEFIPERFRKEFTHWMENMRDWCISRQLWWGHQIPAYYKGDEMIVAEEHPTEDGWIQDEDVLDTWFSSALWPFVVFGWPENTEEMKKFFPTTVLETGRDILFFWVSRMMMMSLVLTDQVPFKHVYLDGLVRDEKNQKMSKSKGNGIEPQELQTAYGTDAMRLMLLLGTTPGNDTIASRQKAEGYRNFVNKLWNASRFIHMQGGDLMAYADLEKDLLKNYEKLNIPQQWILSRLAHITQKVTDGYKSYTTGEAGSLLYETTWNEFCDWYIEISKIQENAYTQKVLQYGMMTLLKLWHPMIPFVTEEIWSTYKQKELLIVSPWPQTQKTFLNESIEEDFRILIEVVRSIRNVRHERSVAPGKYIPVHFVADIKKELLVQFEEVMKKLAKISEIHIHQGRPIMKRKVAVIVYPFEIYMPLDDMVDVAAEKARLTRWVTDKEKELKIVQSKLNNKSFVKNAPADVQAAQEKKKAEIEAVLTTMKQQLTDLE